MCVCVCVCVCIHYCIVSNLNSTLGSGTTFFQQNTVTLQSNFKIK